MATRWSSRTERSEHSPASDEHANRAGTPASTHSLSHAVLAVPAVPRRYRVLQLFFHLYMIPICPVTTCLEKYPYGGECCEKPTLYNYPPAAGDVACTLWMLALARTAGTAIAILAGLLSAQDPAGIVILVCALAVAVPAWAYTPKASCVVPPHAPVTMSARADWARRPRMTEAVARHLRLQPLTGSGATARQPPAVRQQPPQMQMQTVRAHGGCLYSETRFLLRAHVDVASSTRRQYLLIRSWHRRLQRPKHQA